jgi:hypothetical protein
MKNEYSNIRTHHGDRQTNNHADMLNRSSIENGRLTLAVAVVAVQVDEHLAAAAAAGVTAAAAKHGGGRCRAESDLIDFSDGELDFGGDGSEGDASFLLAPFSAAILDLTPLWVLLTRFQF